MGTPIYLTPFGILRVKADDLFLKLLVDWEQSK